MISGWNAVWFRRRRQVCAALLAFLAGLLGATVATANAISAIDVDDNRVTLRFDQPVEGASAIMLNGPERIAVDVGGARVGTVNAAGGIVARTRQGQYTPSTARIVLDLKQPAIVSEGRFAEDGRSLTLALKPVNPERFASAARNGRQSFASPLALAALPPRGGDRGSVTIPLDPPAPANSVPSPKISGGRGSNRPLVVIDAGHGGHDPGAISVYGSRREKDITLAIARAVRDELVKSGRVRVALTRDNDIFLALPERIAVARRLNADLFISIHADSAPNTEAQGATVYTLSEVASDKEAARLAAKENKSDIINGVDLGVQTADVQSILIDLAQRETMNISSGFAALLQRETSPLVDFRSEFHRFANFRVLKAADTPSVLLEVGYITNMDDAQRLVSRDGQKALAVGIRRAVETHFARRLTTR